MSWLKTKQLRDYQWCYYGETTFSSIAYRHRDFCHLYLPFKRSRYCCEVTCMVGDDRWKSGENLTDWIIDDLVKVGMVKDRSKVVDVQIERIPHSYPIYSENYPTELAKMREAIGQFDNLHLAGRTGLFWYNNMDHSMENAFQLSRRLLKKRASFRSPSWRVPLTLNCWFVQQYTVDDRCCTVLP